VSPVLASLLLVVIAVAAALATYVWVSSYLRSAERGVEAPQFRELLKVEGVRAGDGGVIVTVRNIGSAKPVLRAVYVLKGMWPSRLKSWTSSSSRVARAFWRRRRGVGSGAPGWGRVSRFRSHARLSAFHAQAEASAPFSEG